MGSATPIIQGGISDAEMTAQLQRQADDNDRMLAEAAQQTAALEDQISKQDAEMQALVEQQTRAQEIDLANAQKALGVELAAIGEEEDDDDLAVNFDAIQAAMAQGLGGSNSTSRPI